MITLDQNQEYKSSSEGNCMENRINQSIFVLSLDFEVFSGVEKNQKNVGYNCFSLPLPVLLWRTFFRIGNLSKYNIFDGKTHLTIY